MHIFPAIILKSRGTRRRDVASSLFLTFRSDGDHVSHAHHTLDPLLLEHEEELLLFANVSLRR